MSDRASNISKIDDEVKDFQDVLSSGEEASVRKTDESTLAVAGDALLHVDINIVERHKDKYVLSQP